MVDNGSKYCKNIDIKLSKSTNKDISFITKNKNFAKHIIETNIKIDYEYSSYPKNIVLNLMQYVIY